MLGLSSIKCFTIIICILHTNKNYSKSVSEQMMFVPFVRLNQKLNTISFTNVLTQGDFGIILSLIGAIDQTNRFVFHCRMLYLVSYLKQCPSTKLLSYFIVVGKFFCGTAEETK